MPVDDDTLRIMRSAHAASGVLALLRASPGAAVRYAVRCDAPAASEGPPLRGHRPPPAANPHPCRFHGAQFPLSLS